METVYYNYYSFEGTQASGGEDHHAILVRERPSRRQAPAGHKVISLEDYRAKHTLLTAEEPEGEPEHFDAPERTPRRAHGRESLLMNLELAACGALIALAVAACAVFLL